MVLLHYYGSGSDNGKLAPVDAVACLTSEEEIALQKKGRIPIGDPVSYRSDKGRPGGKGKKRRRGIDPNAEMRL